MGVHTESSIKSYAMAKENIVQTNLSKSFLEDGKAIGPSAWTLPFRIPWDEPCPKRFCWAGEWT
jgi:hypothetical protein